jgi:antitoxin (DNA-binding transcriptional repressor) of toxin-antitoxin stability system
MKSISIRELHMNTGKWVRAAGASGEPVIVLDRGRPTARLLPLQEPGQTLFAARPKVAGFEDLPELSTDSADILEEDRR